MSGFGLNQVTMPEAPLGSFLQAAVSLGCIGVELRNDLGRKIFDGVDAAAAGTLVRDHGLRLLGLSQVYPFNRWSDEIADRTSILLEAANAAGSEAISLIPCNDGTRTDNATRADDLARALEYCLPILQEANMMALIEPLGFQRSSLRLKSELVSAIDTLGAWDHFRLIHDTFHHKLAGGGPIFTQRTGIVHISGLNDPTVPLECAEDEHRVLVDDQDRLDNLGQITALRDDGYTGVISFECFAPAIHRLADPVREIKKSIEFISSHIQQEAA